MAFDKDRDILRSSGDTWKRLRMIRSGGGVRNKTVDHILGDRQWRERAMQGFSATMEIRQHTPPGNDLDKPSDDPSNPHRSDTNFFMLANAHGLSVPWQKWEGWYSPDEIQRITIQHEQARPIVDYGEY